MGTARYELKRNAVGKVYFAFKDEGEQLVAVSQSFPDRAALETCITALRNIVKIATFVKEEERLNPPCFLLKRTQSNRYHFWVTGFHGEIMLQSEEYIDMDTCLYCANYFKEQAAEAKIIDFL